MDTTAPGHLLVVAKSPVPGRVKTRLSPWYTPHEAARVAEAALTDTLEAVAAATVGRRVLALDGRTGHWLPAGFDVIPQVPGRLDERLEAAWTDAARGEGAALQLGMDTPQVTPALLEDAVATLGRPDTDAVIGLANDGGWWAIGFSRPVTGAFRGVRMSTCRTGADQVARLHALGLRIRFLPTMRDLDTAEDAAAIAEEAAHTRTAAVVRELAAA
jgi:uncharacterized protein